MKTGWHIAQLNIANSLYPRDDQRMNGFFAQLDAVNALADNSPGFVWRLETEAGNATDIEVRDDPMLIVNISVWETIEALFDFAYRSAHRKVIADRKQWFSRPDGAYQVLWWVPPGHQPTADEGIARLDLLQTSGPGPEAFAFKSKFSPPST